MYRHNSPNTAYWAFRTIRAFERVPNLLIITSHCILYCIFHTLIFYLWFNSSICILFTFPSVLFFRTALLKLFLLPLQYHTLIKYMYILIILYLHMHKFWYEFVTLFFVIQLGIIIFALSLILSHHFYSFDSLQLPNINKRGLSWGQVYWSLLQFTWGGT